MSRVLIRFCKDNRFRIKQKDVGDTVMGLGLTGGDYLDGVNEAFPGMEFRGTFSE